MCSMTNENNTITLAIDLMGGDNNPITRLQAVHRFVERHQEVQIKLFVTSRFSIKQQQELSTLNPRIEVIVTEQAVAMDASPLQFFKQKQTSSMSLAIKSLADGEADIALTAGNTAAVVAFARSWLAPLEASDRPALATIIPGEPKPSLLLDVGATLDYRADDLLRLAQLGSMAATRYLDCGDKPSVALLNVGMEHLKGSDTIQQADRLLNKSDLNYLGFCEGNHLFNGHADVICCDGFVGNITLKACEGLLHWVSQQAQATDKPKSSGWFARLANKQTTTEPSPKLNANQYNGALLLGLNGCVVKAHGNSDGDSFYAAIKKALTYIKGWNQK